LDAADLDARALGEEAADIARRSRDPRDLEPGEYTVVLTPEAVSDIVDFFGYVGASAKAVDEGRSFMSGHIGELVMSERITMTDDASAPGAIGYAFDFEGMRRRRVELVAKGRPVGPVTDSYWAARTGQPNTGHALPAPNAYGPTALNLELGPGDATLDELICSVKRGVYVTRLHYVNVEEPLSVTLTGMTRDGTFLIENGRLTTPLRNLRFTQSMIEAFAACEGLTRDRRFFGAEEANTLVPGMLISKFAFTGQTGAEG